MSAVTVDITGFHHFTLLVRDLDRAAVFYDSVLGLPRKQRPNFSSRGIWYDVAGQELHLIETADVPSRSEAHPALEVRDIRAAVAACAAAGAEIQQDVFVRTHDDSLSAFVRDPDGNLLEFTQHTG
jgi:catechol 2,3-dioxygenase-like lactoylglutathione lyase family enzyme